MIEGNTYLRPQEGDTYLRQRLGRGCAARTGRPTGLGDESTGRNELRLEAVAVS
jgi:hypothetical protein